MRIWIVVADGREALFYDANGATGDRNPGGLSADRFRLVSRIANPQARPHRRLEPGGSERVADNDTGDGQGIDAERSSRRSDQEYFASRIGEEIDRARRADRFDRLVLGATPGILRMIRGVLSAPSRALLAAEVATDVACSDEDALSAQLGTPEPLLRAVRH